MIRLLLKKQFTEIFRSFFFDPKKNRMRSKGATAGWILMFALLIGGTMGGMFTMLSLSMCAGLNDAGVGWLYFTVMGLLSLFLGVFGSVFNTYSSLYLAKDNDLLLSMPVPVRAIMISRLLSVYLLGLLYSAVVIVPAVVVYGVVAAFSVRAVLGGVMMTAVISVLVMVLTCVLGWVVAKASLRLKRKSFVTVAISLLFLGAYYFFYFKASDLIRDMVEHAAEYGMRVKGAAYGLYLFGRMGEGSLSAIALFAGVAALAFFAVWAVLSKGFLKIATASGAAARKVYRERAARRGSLQAALLKKELTRFASNANYMLNCGLGTVFLLAGGVAVLIKGGELLAMLETVFGANSGAAAVLLCAAVCMMISVNDTAAPSVSLEGKSIWQLQVLPVPPGEILRAKLRVQLLITLPPTAFCLICMLFRLRLPAAESALLVCTAAAYAVFSAAFDLFLGLKMANLNWINEIVAIKQGGNVMIATLGGMGITLLLGGGYLLLLSVVGPAIGAAAYLAGFCAVFLIASAVLLGWLRRRGPSVFERL